MPKRATFNPYINHYHVCRCGVWITADTPWEMRDELRAHQSECNA